MLNWYHRGMNEKQNFQSNLDKVAEFVQYQLNQGISEVDIRNTLMKEGGWSEADLDTIFVTFREKPDHHTTQMESKTTDQTKRPSSHNRFIVGIIVVLVLIFGTGGIYLVIDLQSKTESEVESLSTQINQINQKTELSLEIFTPKDTYVVNEKFVDGKYLFNYNGEPFEAVILYGKSRKDLGSRVTYSKTGGKIKAGDFDSNAVLREALLAFKFNENGFQAGRNFFEDTGEYVFSVSVYKCPEAGLENKDCFDLSSEELILTIDPLATATKIITVTNEGLINNETALSEQEIVKTGDSVLNCNIAEDPLCTYEFLDKFTEHFEICEASNGTTPIGWEPALGLLRGYEIKGIQNNLCVVEFWFLEADGAPSDLLGHKMTCKYKNTERTIEKVAAVENCTGPLLEEINKLDFL